MNSNKDCSGTVSIDEMMNTLYFKREQTENNKPQTSEQALKLLLNFSKTKK